MVVFQANVCLAYRFDNVYIFGNDREVKREEQALHALEGEVDMRLDEEC